MPISVSPTTDKGGRANRSGIAVTGDGDGPPNEAALLTISDVASMCSCSTRHVRRLIDGGLCPAPIRLSRLVRLRRSDVEQWIVDGCPRDRRAR